MRWAYRIGPCISPSCRGVRNAQLVQSIVAPRSVQRRVPQPPLIGRALCPPPPSSRRDFSSAPISSQAEQPKPQDARYSSKKRSSLSYVVVGGGILAAAATSLLWWPSSDDGDVINKSTFRAFTITSKEQVSPTAFILTVRSSSSSSSNSSNDGGSARIRQAWAHGLWSVEIKQPQLQIARHYTPLPPLPPPPTSTSTPTAEEGSGQHHDDRDRGTDPAGSELRFLIRKMDGGEMSSYLARLRVGDAVWLRGPHLGFDVARRLGGGGGDGSAGGGRSVVFLAGGTGVAPALQVAHRLLERGSGDGNDSGFRGDKAGQIGREGERHHEHEHDTPAAADRPVVSLLWANRRGVDALGRPSTTTTTTSRTRWWGDLSGFWKQGGVSSSSGNGGNASEKTAITEEGVSILSWQIREMQKRYPDNFRVRYFVDEEKSFIGAEDVIAAATAAAAAAAASRNQKTTSPPKQLAPPPPTEACPWHSAAALETLPNDDDASRSGGGGRGGDGDSNGATSACSCKTAPGERAGVNLLFVSGPDGFIESYAGPKTWHAGGEMQGPVRGLVGRLKDGRGEWDGWLVLKL